MKNGHSEEFLQKQARRLELLVDLRKQGKTYDQIAIEAGISKGTVEKICRANGIGYSEEERQSIYMQTHKECCFKPSVNWQERLDYAYGAGKAVFISATIQANGESEITKKCTKCGTIDTIFSSTLRKKRSRLAECSVCSKSESERLKRIRLLEQKEEKEREKRHDRKIIQVSFPTCLNCGMIVAKARTVCDKCKLEAKRESYRRKDVKRRSNLRRVKRDKDISLKRLYDRDNGICYLCGKVCDFNDSKYIDGIFIVGNNYPTVEHIKPISLGGSDTWDNIKLACLYCNSKKGNREVA